MPISQGRGRDGVTRDVALGQHGDVLASALHGKYAEHTLRGNHFYASTIVAGLAIPISTTTAPTVMLWNPGDSGVNCVLGRYSAGQVSGDAVAATIGLVAVSTLVSAGSNIATGNLITAFAQNVLNTNTFNAKLNNGNRPKVKSSTQGTNTITAGTWVKALGQGWNSILATSVSSGNVFNYDFDGEVVLPPGTAVHVAASAASVALFAQTISWYEVPE